jgi:hypothetical protein
VLLASPQRQKGLPSLALRAGDEQLIFASGLDGKHSAFYIRRAMKTFVSSMVLLGILAASGGIRTLAADRSPTLRKGKVLILKNEYTMEGDIERVGDRYCVRRKLGETWVPAENVLALTASLEDAYAYLHRRINLDDADERLRLARWCRTNGLHQQALVELQAAADLRPDHAETRRLLQYWKQTAATAAKPPAPTGTTPLANAPGSGTDSLPPIEVTTESLGLFATRVQPILMNTCARCHATGRGGHFHLTQVYEDNISNRQTLERNLAAVLAEVNVNQPEASRLLIKAVSDHAHTGQAPLRDRQAAPYRMLENWVKLTVANNPHLRDRVPSVTNTPATNTAVWTPEPRTKGHEDSEWGAEARTPAAPPPAPVARGEKEKTGSNPPSPASNSAATTVDPYDPELFNRKMHPETSKSEPGK